MRLARCGLVAVLALIALLLASCGGTVESGEEEEVRPATVEHLEGPEVTRVTLMPEAAERLGIETAEVRDVDIDGKRRKVMPYAAILYDAEGNTWTYTNPESMVFMRYRVEVLSIEGELAILTDGPPVDTAVVTVGNEELYGAELEFEEE